MPKPNNYLKGFGIQKGSYLDGYYLADISVGHDTIKRYREYQYPTVMTWRVYDNTANYPKFMTDLTNYLQDDRIIYSEYGNPYSCNFGALSVNNATQTDVTISSRGVCTRVYS